MPRAEDIVNQIRPLLGRMHGPPTNVAQEAGRALKVRALAAKIEEVNARLDRCVSLLRQGLRTEAIHLADMAPALLDEAAALDFPQREAFEVQCQEAGIDLPAINVAAVEEINAAYPTEKRLDHLLKWHRRLAIGRGPVKARIRILRRLSAADPRNPVWGEDAVQLERHRHKQLQQEAAAALARKDLGALAALHQECCVEPWLEPPPPPVNRAVQQGHATLLNQHQRARLAMLTSQVDAAFQLQDAAKVAAGLAEWRQLAAAISADVDGLTTPSIADAAHWLDDLRRREAADAEFQRACRTLELALDEQRPLEELERLWAALGRLERAIPRVLKVRYDGRIAEQSLHGRRRHRLVLAGLLCLTLLLASLVGVLIHRQINQSRIEQWAQQVQPLIEAKRWAEAHKLLDRLQQDDPATFESAPLQAALVEVNKALAADEQRASRFATALARAKAAGPAAPDQEAIKLARELVATDEERLALETFESELQSTAAAEQTRRDQAFSQALDTIRSRFLEIRDNPNAAPQAAHVAFAQLETQLADLLRTPAVTPAVAASGQALRTSLLTSLASLDEKMKQQGNQERLLEAARLSFHQPAVHGKALLAFADAFPAHVMSAEFRKSAELIEGWESVALCFPVLDKIKTIRVTTFADAKARFTQIEELAKQPVGVYRQAIDDYREYLSTAVAALDPTLMTDRPNGDLHTLLSNPLVSGLRVVRMKSGLSYYTPRSERRPQASGDTLFVKVAVTFEQALGEKPLGEIGVKTEQVDLAASYLPAPQSEFADAARQMASQRKGDWETFHVRMGELLSKHDQIDPVLRAGIMTQMAKWSVERDWPRHAELAPWLQQLRSVRTDVDWMNPQSNAAAEARRSAADVLKAQPDWGKLVAQVQAWENQAAAALQPRSPFGVVWREDGLRTVVPNASPLVSGRMEALTKMPDGSWRFEPIGRLDRGVPTWLAAANTQPAGTIVYLAGR